MSEEPHRSIPDNFSVGLQKEARDPQTYALIGAAIEVHQRLGHGFLEPVYQEAFAIELQHRSIPFKREEPLRIMYRERELACGYKADFICYNEIIVELKALVKVGPIEEAQLLNYLKATGCHRGLLLNFGGPSLEWVRRVWESPRFEIHRFHRLHR